MEIYVDEMPKGCWKYVDKDYLKFIIWEDKEPYKISDLLGEKDE